MLPQTIETVSPSKYIHIMAYTIDYHCAANQYISNSEKLESVTVSVDVMGSNPRVSVWSGVSIACHKFGYASPTKQFTMRLRPHAHLFFRAQWSFWDDADAVDVGYNI
eukprot:1089381-Amphidinium_carterae.1